MNHLIIVRPEPAGQYTALVWGLPDIRAVAATEAEAIVMVKQRLEEWLAGARIIQVRAAMPSLQGDSASNTQRSEVDRQLEAEYLEDLARFRREDLERTLREYDQECSDSSSTPTT